MISKLRKLYHIITFGFQNSESASGGVGEDGMGLIVIDPGLNTTVQDAGRPGYREWGVPAGGAFDRGSADLANALVGNPPTCAVLELTLIGGVYQADGPLALALAGAPMEARVVGPSGGGPVLATPLSWT